jgi:hypothetical protein
MFFFSKAPLGLSLIFSSGKKVTPVLLCPLITAVFAGALEVRKKWLVTALNFTSVLVSKR